MESFFHLHSGLPREGPGSDASTCEALRRLPALPENPVVVDLGCGPGRQTLVLARELGTPILAVDTHQPYLDDLERAARREGLESLVETRCASMTNLDLPPESLDLVWSEGAFYAVGVDAQLRRLHPLLRPDGLVVFTDVAWLTDAPSAEARDFWREYPAMRSVGASLQAFADLGYEVLDSFMLPEEDWWAEYYDPLLERMGALQREAAGDPELARILEGTGREIDLRRRHGDDYGYFFYLCRKA